MRRLQAAAFARISKALADPQRCEILERTAQGAFCCSALVQIFPLTQATVSHHLKELTDAGLLGRRKRGQLAYYYFRPETMEAYIAELSRRMRLRPVTQAPERAVSGL